jgi:two-component system CheB/CheR fusion protein
VSTAERDPQFEGLVDFIRDARGFDFTGYKRPSLMRRIQKRMQDAKIDGFDNYREYLERNGDEFGHLFDTILINVTSFFRDPAAWEYITRQIVPRIVEARAPADGIRIWSTGCSTGQEAYTLAMVFAGAMPEDDFKQRVKIYATDVDDGALRIGRHATYTAEQLEPVPPELRERYFEPGNGSFGFRTDLRRAVIFGRHDLVQDPPISRIDLLVSRNTLMYFDVPTQQRILANFQFALRDDGFMFLGKSEVLVARSPLFTAVDLRRRVFSRAPSDTRRDRGVPRPTDDADGLLEAAQLEAIRDAGFEAAPISQIVIDRGGKLAAANMQARMLFGLNQRDIGALLQDLELSYRPVELRSRIEQAYTDRHAVNLRDVEWHTGTEIRSVDVQVTPLTSPTGEALGVAVTYSDVTRYRRLQEALQEAKREVETAYEELQSTVEELETTNEELQSTNEELETTNEELQSTNEELETMNEELQSTNEELETINDELQQRTDDVNDLNAFLEAVLGSLSAGVVVLDTELRIQAWNDAASELWGLRADEVQGQHLLNLDIGLAVDQLRTPVRAALAGESTDGLVVDAVNRRGRPVLVRLRFAPLSNDGIAGIRGAIVMMEVNDGAGHDGG